MAEGSARIRATGYKSSFAPSLHRFAPPRHRSASVFDRLGRWVDQAWFAYPALLLLQLKVIWGDWWYRDLTTGDTSSYFVTAYAWYRDFGVDLVWSPLYTAFYGSLLFLSPDAYVVTELHRLISVLSVAALVLAVMRRLLPHSVAWFVAAWWTLLHANFNAMYEVHLFSLIPVLVAVRVVLSSTRSWARGVAVALLLSSTILLRNELILPTGILVGLCLVWEVRTIVTSRAARASRLRTLLASYAIPFLVAAPILGFFSWQSLRRDPDIAASWKSKTDLTFCQHHALAYQQFHRDWKLSPWTECDQLLQDHFGKTSVTVFEALRLNPHAMLDHFATNLNLLPMGMQVALFNATSGSVTPDVIMVPLRSPGALASSITLVVLLAVGAIVLYRDRRYWWPHWLRQRAWGWVALASLAAGVLVSMLVIRPRPEYLYGPALLLMAGSGMGVAAIARRWTKLQRAHVLTPPLMAGALLLAPMYYAEYSVEGGRVANRPLLREYRRIDPLGEAIAMPGTVFMKGHYSTDIWNYVFKQGPLKVIEYHGLGDRSADTPLEAFLDRRGVTVFYLDEGLLADLEREPLAQRFLVAPESVGWEVIGSQNDADSRWMLLRKVRSA